LHVPALYHPTRLMVSRTQYVEERADTWVRPYEVGGAKWIVKRVVCEELSIP